MACWGGSARVGLRTCIVAPSTRRKVAVTDVGGCRSGALLLGEGPLPGLSRWRALRDQSLCLGPRPADVFVEFIR